MHEYYASNRDKFKKGMHKFLDLIAPELERTSGKQYAGLLYRFAMDLNMGLSLSIEHPYNIFENFSLSSSPINVDFSKSLPAVIF